MGRQSDYVHLEDCTIRKETASAFLVEFDGTDYWLPKTQVADADNYAEGDEGVTLSITRWIAYQKGIEGEES